jgi:hypothetical protein
MWTEVYEKSERIKEGLKQALSGAHMTCPVILSRRHTDIVQITDRGPPSHR